MHLDARVMGDELGQARRQVAAGRTAAGVDHPAPVVAALQRQVERALRRAVEGDAALLELAHAIGGLGAEDLDRLGRGKCRVLR